MIFAIDFDGTIVDTNLMKSAWIAENLGRKVPPWNCNRTDCVPIIGLASYEKMANDVFDREGTLGTPPVPGAVPAIRALSRLAELIVVTVRSGERLEFATEWLQMHRVLDLFKAVRSSKESSKEQVCAEYAAVALIDDDVRHLREAQNTGLQRILLQHGRKEEKPDETGILFCNSWEKVVALLDRGIWDPR